MNYNGREQIRWIRGIARKSTLRNMSIRIAKLIKACSTEPDLFMVALDLLSESAKIIDEKNSNDIFEFYISIQLCYLHSKSQYSTSCDSDQFNSLLDKIAQLKELSNRVRNFLIHYDSLDHLDLEALYLNHMFAWLQRRGKFY